MLTDEQKREILAKCREDIDCFDEKCTIAIDAVEKYRCPVNSDLLDEMWKVFEEWCDYNDLDPEETLDPDELEYELFWFNDGTPAQESAEDKVRKVIGMMEETAKKDDLGNLTKKQLVELCVKVYDGLKEIAQ